MFLKRTRILLAMEGERAFTQPNQTPMGTTGGLPFYGNIYVGRVDSQSYQPPKQGGSGLISEKFQSLWDVPTVREKVQKCPYFALADQVIYHNMDPDYLDPGILTDEEHQLMLLFSRAYYEKWKEIHRRPASFAPRARIKLGSTRLLDEVLEVVHVPMDIGEVLKKEYLLDDAALIAMNPECWSTAYLDEANMDQLSGRVLDYAGISEDAMATIFKLLHQMRRIWIVRNDTAVRQEVVLPFHDGVTLYDLYLRLGLKPYSGQLKVYDYIDEKGTPLTVTLNSEDNYFDFLVTLFQKADLSKATLSELADDADNTCRYAITVEPFTVDERRVGRWF